MTIDHISSFLSKVKRMSLLETRHTAGDICA